MEEGAHHSLAKILSATSSTSSSLEASAAAAAAAAAAALSCLVTDAASAKVFQPHKRKTFPQSNPDSKPQTPFKLETLILSQAVGEADFLGPLITISSSSGDDASSLSSSSSSAAAAAAAAALAKLSKWNPDIKEILCEEGGMQAAPPPLYRSFALLPLAAFSSSSSAIQAIAHMCASDDPAILKFAGFNL